MSDRKKTILHVEDDPDFHSYVDALVSDFANVSSVYTGAEAKKLLSGVVFDLFLLDLVLKDVSGSAMARDLKKAYPHVPIVILSSHDVTDAIDEADATFVKGRFDEQEFIDTIKKLLS